MSSKNKTLAMKKADKYFSLFIRQRDKDKPCITCGKYTDLKDCGHFISRRYQSTRYDEKNAHGQCQKCNRFEHGRQFEHSKAVDRLYGEGTANKLHDKSRMLCKRNKHDFEVIADYYRNLVK